MALPYLYGAGLPPTIISNQDLILPANGGSVAIPFVVCDTVVSQDIQIRTTDATGSHTLEMIFATDDSGRLTPIMDTYQTFSYQGAGNNRQVANLNHSIRIDIGTTWLIIRNSSGVQSRLLAIDVGTLDVNCVGTTILGGSLANGLGSELWTPSQRIPIVRINASTGLVQGGVL